MTPPPRTLDELYGLVSFAIHRAERATAAGDAGLAAATFLDASYLEEEIAERLPADGVEGAVARRGAVSAALNAQQYSRALEVAERYLADGQVSGALREKLVALLAEANRGLSAVTAMPDVMIEPSARFRLAA
jgi:hypothetical protein